VHTLPKETMKLTRDTTEGNDVRVPRATKRVYRGQRRACTEGNDVRVPTQATLTRKPYPLTSDDRDLTPLGQECDERHPLRP
jgi:hypothetical protein